METTEGKSDVHGPLVLSCRKCNAIIGDSYSFVCSDEKQKSITLNAVSNIERTPDLYTSRTGQDEGSTYFLFNCSKCKNQLGKYYVTTPKHLDKFRDRFNLLTEKLDSYELGKAQHGTIPEPEELIIPDQKDINMDMFNQTNDVDKLKLVVVELAGRIEKLERVLSLSQIPTVLTKRDRDQITE